MVLSLVDLSLRSITKGIKDGAIQNPHFLYPILRERVLDMAIKQGLTNHPNGLEVLTSVEFLNGMTSISAKACNDNDLEFLERLVASLATKLPNGETVGAAIKQLNLKVHDAGIRGSHFKNEKTYSDTISKVFDLIAHCPNTTSLAFQMSKSGVKRGYWPLNENGNIACNRVMENLIELSIVCNEKCILDNDHPIINFKQLKTLKLDNCYFYNSTWPKILEKIPFVENLHLFDAHANCNGLDSILPSPLPHLKSLKVYGSWRFFECNNAFVDNLMECQQLRQVHLNLYKATTDDESLVRLANMDIDLKLKIRLLVLGNDAAKNAAIFDSSSRFKVVQIFQKRMDSFELYVWREWNEQFSTALEDLVNTCSNLTSFGITHPYFSGNQPKIEFEETKRFNAAMLQFFGNLGRAQQLKGLRLIGNIDETVLSVVFENCLNLVRLDISDCPSLRDQHLIDWVSRGGGKLTDLVVEDCNNVTSEGIIPILVRSADGLLHYCCIDLGQGSGGRNWKKVRRYHCPNANDIKGDDPLLIP